MKTLFMLIPFLKKLLIDTNAEEVRRVEDLLINNKILYRINTKRARGSIGSALDSRAYASSNLAMYKGGDTPLVVYEIYVRRKDFENAKNLITKKVD
jgi:hypothetical protein